MPALDFLKQKSFWWPLAFGIITALLGYWKAGGFGPEPPLLSPPEPKTKVVVDSGYGDQWKGTADSLLALLTHRKPQEETLWRDMPDTCQKWVDYYKKWANQLQDELLRYQCSGTIHVRDSTYSWLKITGSFTYPEGGGRLSYTFLHQPYFNKPRFGFELGLPLLDFPWAELSFRWKNTNHWFGIMAQPQLENSEIKTQFGLLWRWQF